MNTKIEIQTALANEARRQELKFKISNLQGSANATAALQQRISALNADAARELIALQAELAALNAGAGSGITDDFGEKSSMTQLLENERRAGNSAVIDLIKSDQNATEDDATAAWEAAAAAVHQTPPDLPFQRGKYIGAAYRTRLAAAGVINADNWSEFSAWVYATDKETILSAT